MRQDPDIPDARDVRFRRSEAQSDLLTRHVATLRNCVLLRDFWAHIWAHELAPSRWCQDIDARARAAVSSARRQRDRTA